MAALTDDRRRPVPQTAAPITTPDPAGPGVDPRWSARSRALAGGGATAIAIVGGLLGDMAWGAPAWIALGLAAVAFGGASWRPVARLFDRAGGIVAVGIVTLLLLGTGGPESPFQDMYAIVLVYSAVVMGWRRLAFDTVLVGLAAVAVGIGEGAGAAYHVDVAIDLAVWVTLAVLAGGLSRRLGTVARRQRADAALVAAADTAMITTDAEGRVRSWNPAASRLYGVRQHDAIGRHIADVVQSPDDDPSRGSTGRLERIRYGTRHHRSDGTAIDVEVTAWPVPSEDGGQVMGMLVRDITSHRATDVQLRLQQERFRVFAQQARGVVYRFEREPVPRLAFLSHRMHDLLGLDPAAVQTDARVVLERIHPDDGVPFDPDDGTGRFAEGVHEYRVQHVDGSWVWIEDHHQPEFADDGRIIASQGILYDVSDRKQLEQAREQALADAQETARQLERTTMAQTVFLRSVSHELRTPMTLVRGFARTLEQYGDDLDEDARAMLVERLLRGIDRLDDHLSDLLDIQARDDATHLHDRETVDVSEVCFDAVAAIDTTAHRVVVTATRGQVLADRRQVARAVTALVRNAVQHTPAGTQVVVRTEQTSETVRIVVEDDGPGIEDELCGRLFEPFVQGRTAATAPSPGSGIGLTLVRQIALRHGGTVTCRPVEPRGAAFELTLPLHRPSHTQHGHSHAPEVGQPT